MHRNKYNILQSRFWRIVQAWRDIAINVSYKELWILLIDKNMNKMDLKVKAGVAPLQLQNLGNVKILQRMFF